jgi:hypothetical protein
MLSRLTARGQIVTLKVMKTVGTAIILALVSLVASQAHAFTVTGLSNPYGIVVDAKTGYIYVSNMNGAPDAKDGNGFISRLKGDGTLDQQKFIAGGTPKVALSAPKGMAIAGTTIYVADIDKLHAFDVATGAFLFDVNFGTLPVQHFYDIRLGTDGALYVADGPGNTIYRVDIPKQHEVTTYVSGESLGQPHGLTWFPVRQSWVVAGWSSGQVTAYDKVGHRQPFPPIFLRTLEGIDADESGNMFVASTGLSALYRIAANFALYGFQLRVVSPGGVAYHKASDQLLVAFPEGGTVQSYPIQLEQMTAPPPPTTFLQLPPPIEKMPEPPTPPQEPAAGQAQPEGTPPAGAEAKSAEAPKEATAKKEEPKKEETKRPEPAKQPPPQKKPSPAKTEAPKPETPATAPPNAPTKKGINFNNLHLPKGSD